MRPSRNTMMVHAATPSSLNILLVLAFTIICLILPAAARVLSIYNPRALISTNADPLQGVDIPSSIAVPSGNVLHLAFPAVGHQHYTFNGTQWVNYNASAKLYSSASGHKMVVGRHFFLAQPDASGGQPTWETFDHVHHPTVVSLVTAKGIHSVTVDADSITWNLLQATSHSSSKELLGDVTYVQRLKTRRGLPPSSTTGAKKGDTHSSKYSAVYAYYVKSS